MGAFNVAVVIPRGGRPSIAHSVAIAMEPHRGEEWIWYAIGAHNWSEIAAVLLRDGRWMDPPEHGWQDDYTGVGDEVIVVRCKD